MTSAIARSGIGDALQPHRVAFAALLLIMIAGTRTGYAQAPATVDRGDFAVVYQATSVYPKLAKALKAKGTIEALVGALNAKYAFPRAVPIVFTDCEPGGNARFEPPAHRIVICYEFLNVFGTLFKEQLGSNDADVGTAMLHTLSFFFVHELGHALCTEWNVPGTAQDQEINADQLATLALIEMGDRYVVAAIDGANFLRLLGTKVPADYFDEHLLGEQRFFQTLRLIYGSNPKAFPQIASVMPKLDTKQDEAARDAACVRDFEAVRAKWRSVLKHRELTDVTDDDLAALVAQMQEQPTSPLPPEAPPPSSPAPLLQPRPESPAARPIYTKWWFWTGIAVGALIIVGVSTNGQP